MLNQRKSWTSQEDQLLTKLYQQNKLQILNQSLHWNFIASQFNLSQTTPKRTGKQCRERWFNQLNPQIVKNHSWNQEDKKSLLHLHDLHGNRWAFIAKHFPGRTDNCIKNFMNSTLRKALRLLNQFVSKNRKFKEFKFKNLKQYKVDLVNKILFFSGTKNPLNHFQQDFMLSSSECLSKQQLLSEVYRLASDIKSRLMWIQSEIDQKQTSLDTKSNYRTIPCFEEMIQRIQELNGICKKRKQKKSKNESFRWKKSYGKVQDGQLGSFNFHSGSLLESFSNVRGMTIKIEQGKEQNQPNQPQIQIRNASNESQSGGNQGKRLCQVQKKIEDCGQKTFKQKAQQQTQNNGKNQSNSSKRSRRQSELTNTVIVKSPQSTEFNRQLEITHDTFPNNPIEHTSMRFIEQVGTEARETQKQDSKQTNDMNTRQSFQSIPDKSKDSNPSDTPNVDEDSSVSMEDEYEYYVFSEYIQDENYIPLYPSYRNSGAKSQNCQYRMVQYPEINEEHGSQEQVI